MNHIHRICRLPAGLPRRASVLLTCGAAVPATQRAGSRPSDCHQYPLLPVHISTRRATTLGPVVTAPRVVA